MNESEIVNSFEILGNHANNEFLAVAVWTYIGIFIGGGLITNLILLKILVFNTKTEGEFGFMSRSFVFYKDSREVSKNMWIFKKNVVMDFKTIVLELCFFNL